ncbi:MAG: flagellar biosynthetic protein FliQ [Nakamurella sp.]
MTDSQIIDIAFATMQLAAKLAAPSLLTALVIGFAVSTFQAATQIQEFTLAFVPKVIGVAIALIASGSWMLNSVISFTQELFQKIPSLLG